MTTTAAAHTPQPYHLTKDGLLTGQELRALFNAACQALPLHNSITISLPAFCGEYPEMVLDQTRRSALEDLIEDGLIILPAGTDQQTPGSTLIIRQMQLEDIAHLCDTAAHRAAYVLKFGEQGYNELKSYIERNPGQFNPHRRTRVLSECKMVLELQRPLTTQDYVL